MTRKIRLELDALEVDTFATTPAGAARPGTVHGASGEVSLGDTCDLCQTEDVGLCNGYGQTEALTCRCQTGGGTCMYPTDSCGPGQTYGEATCYCLYPRTDPHVCCGAEPSQGGGGMC